jgi:demethylmenaquinone methyltransferase/2-methoxy-6-polyprenyl-1,4-benzoquinol methylase
MEDFGFRKVNRDEKQHLVNEVFESVAFRYDLMNDLMSAGLHRLWKDTLIDWLAPRKNKHLIDVAGGTGDIAFRFLNRLKDEGKVTIVDRNEQMLLEGKSRYTVSFKNNNIEWICADAMELPFSDESFDYFTISFGIRNVLDIKKCLEESYRVLKPGGRLLILEFSAVDNKTLKKLYDLYSLNIVPKLGRFVTGDEDSYRYLVESIRKFPSQEEFLSMINTAGFKQTKFRNLTFGVVALHSGWKV